jgi:hypothetical protein
MVDDLKRPDAVSRNERIHRGHARATAMRSARHATTSAADGRLSLPNMSTPFSPRLPAEDRTLTSPPHLVNQYVGLRGACADEVRAADRLPVRVLRIQDQGAARGTTRRVRGTRVRPAACPISAQTTLSRSSKPCRARGGKRVSKPSPDTSHHPPPPPFQLPTR